MPTQFETTLGRFLSRFLGFGPRQQVALTAEPALGSAYVDRRNRIVYAPASDLVGQAVYVHGPIPARFGWRVFRRRVGWTLAWASVWLAVEWALRVFADGLFTDLVRIACAFGFASSPHEALGSFRAYATSWLRYPVGFILGAAVVLAWLDAFSGIATVIGTLTR